MSILGQKLQNMTESYNNYSPAYESYNPDCGGGVLLEAETFDDMTDIIEACYNYDIKQIKCMNENYTALNPLMENKIKDVVSMIKDKLKDLFNRFKAFMKSIQANMSSLTLDSKETYEKYKDKIKGKEIEIFGYYYNLDMTNMIKNSKKVAINIQKEANEFADQKIQEEIMQYLTYITKDRIYGYLRSTSVPGYKPNKIRMRVKPEHVKKDIDDLISKKDIKNTFEPLIKALESIMKELDKRSKFTKDEDDIVIIKRGYDVANDFISRLTMMSNEYIKAAKEANSFYKKIIIGMVSGKEKVKQ